MKDMQLSANFYLSEFTKSKTADYYKIDNSPSELVISNLKLLCDRVLQPTRNHFKRSIKISSGYRCLQLNELCNGSSNSQHVFGQAADFSIPGISLLDICKWIDSNLLYDQLIYEHRSWIHVSFSSRRNRHELLTCHFAGKYLPGLHE